MPRHTVRLERTVLEFQYVTVDTKTYDSEEISFRALNEVTKDAWNSTSQGKGTPHLAHMREV